MTIEEEVEELVQSGHAGDGAAGAVVLARVRATIQEKAPEAALWLEAASRLKMREAAAEVLKLLRHPPSEADLFRAAVNASRAMFVPSDADAPTVVALLCRIADHELATEPVLARSALLGAVMLDEMSWQRTFSLRVLDWPAGNLESIFRAACGWIDGEPSRPAAAHDRGALYRTVRMFEERSRQIAHREREINATRAVALELLALLVSSNDLGELLRSLAQIYSQETDPRMRAGAASALGILLRRNIAADAVLRSQGLEAVDVFLRSAQTAPLPTFYRAAAT